MSPQGRPKGESTPQRVSAEGIPTSPQGRPKGESTPQRVSAEGIPTSPQGRPEGESVPQRESAEVAWVSTLLALTPEGLACPAGGFHVDPWRPVDRALITHAHADHARPGHARYLGVERGLPLLRARLPGATIETMRYGEVRRIGEVDVSFHPAGHVLGSAQVRIARGGEVTVVSGDYKLAPDPTCEPFEPVACTTFVTESTFGLPVYRWDPPSATLDDIARWWQANRDQRVASVLFAYALGKAQRVLAGLAGRDAILGPVYVHGAVETINAAYREAGVALPPTRRAAEAGEGTEWAGALIVAPPSARGSRWLARFGPARTAFASGWMAIRGARRRAGLDRGFVLSDHADWPGLNKAIDATGARSIRVTHGYRDELVRWIGESASIPGREARALDARFESGPGDEDAVPPEGGER